MNISTTGCEYGDQSSWCHADIGSESEKIMCYYGTNADLCCETCARYANNANKGSSLEFNILRCIK